jgi:cyclic beta-1,2-glucan synthetase
LVTAFAVQLVQRLRDQDPAVTPALLWLNQRLSAQGTTPDHIVRVEHQRQAAMNVTVRNVILSMSLMSALDWAEFFESVSLVDEVLAKAGPHYAAMDFASRDGYRHAIEELARGSGRSELAVARTAVLHAKARRVAARGAGEPPDDRREDPGFDLIGPGRLGFERALGFRASVPRRLLRAYVGAATPGYLGTTVILTGLMLVPPLSRLAHRAWARWACSCSRCSPSSLPRTWRSRC